MAIQAKDAALDAGADPGRENIYAIGFGSYRGDNRSDGHGGVAVENFHQMALLIRHLMGNHDERHSGIDRQALQQFHTGVYSARSSPDPDYEVRKGAIAVEVLRRIAGYHPLGVI
jgi:hypothetical protein